MKTTKKGKKKNAKKSKGSKSKESWTHDGGVVFDDDSKGKGTEIKKGPRRTQEKDERQRRGRLKMLDRLKSDQFRRKMVHKVKFSDVIEPEEEKESSEPRRLKKTPPPPNSRPALQRLRDLLNPSTSKQQMIREDTDEEDDDLNSEASDKNDTGDEFSVRSNDQEIQVRVSKLSATDAVVDEPEDKADGGEAEFDHDIVDDSHDQCTQYQKFFSSEQSSNEQTRQLKLLEVDSDIEVIGSVSHLNSEQTHVKRLQRFGDIAGLPRLWRSRKSEEFSDPLESLVLSYLVTYADSLIEGRDYHNDPSMMRAIVAHVGTHIIRAKMAVLKHNAKLKKRAVELAQVSAELKETKSKKRKANAGAEAVPIAIPTKSSVESDSFSTEIGQDQGFVLPRVLVLCPFRSTARKFVFGLKDILGSNTTISSAVKFDEEFGYEEEDGGFSQESEDEQVVDEDSGSKPSVRRHGAHHMPKDWQMLFRDNIDDDFKFGIQINPGQGKGAGADKGAYMRLYADFYAADIIVASPLGLKLVVDGSNGKLSFDFLSSIEIVILHQADVMYMQNWEHVDYILSKVNAMPSSDHGTDFSRVRPYFLEGLGACHRQVIMSTEYNAPAMQASFRTFARSIAGMARFRKYPGVEAVRSTGGQLVLNKSKFAGSIAEACCSRLAQVFQRIHSPLGLVGAEDARFEYFCEHVLSPLLKSEQKRVLIFAPSYLSFVRIRNELIRREVDAVCISEYSRESEISRGRSRFFHGDRNICLYSGRAHFFRRFLVRGAAHLIFYSVPEQASFYPEVVNLLVEAEQVGFGDRKLHVQTLDVSCLVLYTIYEKMALERIVGCDRCSHMLSSTKSSFMFK